MATPIVDIQQHSGSEAISPPREEELPRVVFKKPIQTNCDNGNDSESSESESTLAEPLQGGGEYDSTLAEPLQGGGEYDSSLAEPLKGGGEYDSSLAEPLKVDGIVAGGYSGSMTDASRVYLRPRLVPGLDGPVSIAEMWKLMPGEQDELGGDGFSSPAIAPGLDVPHYPLAYAIHLPVDQPFFPRLLGPGYLNMPVTHMMDGFGGMLHAPAFPALDPLDMSSHAPGYFHPTSSTSEQSAASGAGDSEDQAELVEENNKDTASVNTTTLMVQNIPRQLTRQKIMDAMQADGFGDCYDYCYVPRCFESNMNKGYAFVNFISWETANAFKKTWDRTFKLGTFQRHRPKPIRVTPAALQGYARNSAFAGSKKICRIRNGEYRPLVCN